MSVRYSLTSQRAALSQAVPPKAHRKEPTLVHASTATAVLLMRVSVGGIAEQPEQ